MMWFYSFSLIFLSFVVLAGSPDRISSIHKNLSSSEKIYISQGMATLVEFPNPINEVRVGNSQVIKAVISTVSPKELSLFLNTYQLGPTNIIVKSDKRVYVFDIIPSQFNHQDFIKVSGAYGSPQYSKNDQTVIDGGEFKPAPTMQLNSSSKLIESSKLGFSK